MNAFFHVSELIKVVVVDIQFDCPNRKNMKDVLLGAQALASEKRLIILEWLKDPASHFGPHKRSDEAEGVCGLDIARKLGISSASTSAHLKVLTLAGLTCPARIAKFAYFSRAESELAALAQRIAAL